MSRFYSRGFIDACAARNVNPDSLLKVALHISPELRALFTSGLIGRTFKAMKKAIPTKAEFAEKPGVIKTLEGEVPYREGDAILTGVKGERWPVERGKFDKKYMSIADMPGFFTPKAGPVRARQINQDFEVPVSWQNVPLKGKPGDFRLKYGPGDYGAVDQDIFNKTYNILP